MRARRFAGIVPLLALLALPAPGRAEKPSFVIPDRPDDPRLRMDAEMWVLPASGLEIRVQFLEGGSHREFLRERAPGLEDPFSPNGLFPEEHYVFRLDLTNQSDQLVTFHPGNVLIITNQNEEELPLEYSDFYRALMIRGDAAEDYLKRWVKVYWDGAIILNPGESASKLIAFNPPRDKWRRMKLYISALQVGAETHHFSFPYEKKKGKKARPMPLPEETEDDEAS